MESVYHIISYRLWDATLRTKVYIGYIQLIWDAMQYNSNIVSYINTPKIQILLQ